MWYHIKRRCDRGKNVKYNPHAFTEQGIYMLATVLRGELASGMYHQRYKDALNIALQTADHTSYSWLKRESLEHVATAAMHLRDFKMAYEYYSRYANALMAEGKGVPYELKELIESSN